MFDRSLPVIVAERIFPSGHENVSIRFPLREMAPRCAGSRFRSPVPLHGSGAAPHTGRYHGLLATATGELYRLQVLLSAYRSSLLAIAFVMANWLACPSPCLQDADRRVAGKRRRYRMTSKSSFDGKSAVMEIGCGKRGVETSVRVRIASFHRRISLL